MSTVGLVLAAGAGRRMGRPKALVRLTPGGPTLVETAVGRVRAAGCDRVVVVVGAEAGDAADAVSGTGAEVVVATDWDEGMGASLRAGLAHLEAGAPTPSPVVAVVTLVDLPDVSAEVVARVLAAAAPEGAAALVRAAYDGVPGHPVVLGRDHWAAVRATARGDRGARDHLRATPHRLVECGDLATGRDVDTEADLPERG
ncbi:nucleotidyltransferase family protein [Fodinibacter luteus]|uniref:Nucleotidyltransferase family protein n=1 Tax=Fodinibacter luteus TaxID=552064 RepID=A0ABP8KHP9_9MICO